MALLKKRSQWVDFSWSQFLYYSRLELVQCKMEHWIVMTVIKNVTYCLDHTEWVIEFMMMDLWEGFENSKALFNSFLLVL